MFDQQLQFLRRQKKVLPEAIRFGAMLEVPALAEVLDVIAPKLSFLSIGTNDLTQFLFAADRSNPKLAERMMRIARDTLAATSVAILSDYNKGVLAGDIPAQLIAAAKAGGRRVVVDPKGPDYARYAGADVVTPNRRELAEATGLPVDSEAAIVTAAQELRNAHGFGAVLVTLSVAALTASLLGVVATLVADPSLVSREWGWTTQRDVAAMVRDAWNFQQLNPFGHTS